MQKEDQENEVATQEMKIGYMGNDTHFWLGVAQRFESTYSEINFSFSQLNDLANKTAEELFVQIALEKYTILYIDLETLTHIKLKLCKYIAKDNVTKLMPTIALHTKKEAEIYIKRALLAGVRLNHIKCNETHDLVYDALSFLDVNQTIRPDYVSAEYSHLTFLYQDLRLTYTTDEYFHVETNSPLLEGEDIIIEDHFLKKTMRTKLFYVKNQKSSNLYYNTRYSFDIHFTYNNQEFDHLDKGVQGNLELASEKFDYKAIFDNIENQKLADQQIIVKRKISEWITNQAGKNIPKKIKILAIDRKLELFKQLALEKQGLPFNINIQSQLGGNQYQIKRIMPHFIVYNMDNFGDLESDNEDLNGILNLEKMIKAISKIEGYTPIIIVFQHGKHVWDLQDTIDYEKLISHKMDLSLDLIKQLGESLSKKQKHIDNQEDSKRVYFKATDPESIITFKRPIEIISMTESIIYFRCDSTIPDWTVFKLFNPVEILLTVVPHKDSGTYTNEKSIYRALINGADEIAKQKIRTFINTLVEESQKSAEGDTGPDDSTEEA